MTIVVDASVIIACVTGEPERDALVAATANHVLVAPESLPWEVGNALSAGFKRGRFTLDQALAAVAFYQQMAVGLHPVDLDAAVRLAHQVKVYAYDAYMLQCAIESGGQLLTLDRGLKTAARGLGVPVLEIVP
jgi:predicted nucleic acid-binding protein